MKLDKKGIELALSTVITIIIGLILFGLGMALFTQVAQGGQDQLAPLQAEVTESLAGLECDSQEWLCIPSIRIDQGDRNVYNTYVTNLAENSGEFRLDFSLLDSIDADTFKIEKADCGYIIITPFLGTVPLNRGEVGKIPMYVDTSQVTNTCSFPGALKIVHSDSDGDVGEGNEATSTIIIRVE